MSSGEHESVVDQCSTARLKIVLVLWIVQPDHDHETSWLGIPPVHNASFLKL